MCGVYLHVSITLCCIFSGWKPSAYRLKVLMGKSVILPLGFCLMTGLTEAFAQECISLKPSFGEGYRCFFDNISSKIRHCVIVVFFFSEKDFLMRNWVMKIHDQMECKKYGRPPNLARNIIHEKKVCALHVKSIYLTLVFQCNECMCNWGGLGTPGKQVSNLIERGHLSKKSRDAMEFN